MPYRSIDELPSYTKKYSEKIRKQMLHVFNTVYQSTNGNEKRAFMAMHSVLKKRFKEGQNRSKESHADYFSMLTDNFLGNLKG
jgi:predicted secreted protein